VKIILSFAGRKPGSTLIDISELTQPGLVVEIDVTVVLGG